MKTLRQALIIEYEVIKERQRCLRAIDNLKDWYEEKFDKERAHMASIVLNKAKDYIGY